MWADNSGMVHLMFTTILFLILLLGNATFATISYGTIDDQFGDSVTGRLPTYSGHWNYGPSCPGCGVQPNKTKTFMGSWHDTTSNNPSDNPPHTVDLLFNGTAIWVYCIVPNSVGSDTTFVNISFYLDGELAGNYTHIPDKKSSEMNYNVTVYSSMELTNALHNLSMVAMQEPRASLLLFDWAEYAYVEDIVTFSIAHSPGLSTISSTTTPTSSQATVTSSGGQVASMPSMPSASHHKTAVLLGGVIGSIGGLIVIATLTVLVRRRRHRARSVGRARNSQFLRDSWEPTTMSSVRYPTVNQPVLALTNTLSQYIAPGTGAYDLNTRHNDEVRSGVEASGTNMATLCMDETTQLEEARARERDEEVFVQRIRKFREQVSDLRRWAAQQQLSAESP